MATDVVAFPPLPDAAALEELITKLHLDIDACGPNPTPKWAAAHQQLGVVYRDRLDLTDSAKEENIEKAIHHLHQALVVFSKETHPRNWGLLQHQLGVCFLQRKGGLGRPGHIEDALRHFQQAQTELSVEKNTPRAWAAIQFCLGDGFMLRERGNRGENEDAALGHYKNAQRVFNKKDFPSVWGKCCHALASLHLNRSTGDPEDNLLSYLRELENSLQVFTQDHFPQTCIDTHETLGNTYLDKVTGKREDNQAKALKHFDDALAVTHHDTSVLRLVEIELKLQATAATHGVYGLYLDEGHLKLQRELDAQRQLEEDLRRAQEEKDREAARLEDEERARMSQADLDKKRREEELREQELARQQVAEEAERKKSTTRDEKRRQKELQKLKKEQEAHEKQRAKAEKERLKREKEKKEEEQKGVPRERSAGMAPTIKVANTAVQAGFLSKRSGKGLLGNKLVRVYCVVRDLTFSYYDKKHVNITEGGAFEIIGPALGTIDLNVFTVRSLMDASGKPFGFVQKSVSSKMDFHPDCVFEAKSRSERDFWLEIIVSPPERRAALMNQLKEQKGVWHARASLSVPGR